MKEDLITIIVDYLVEKICKYTECNDLSFDWTYRYGKFTLEFDLVKTHFTILAKPNKNHRNLGMSIIPDEKGITIIGFDYIDNFDQVANILVEFKKELTFFEEVFNSLKCRMYINDNLELLISSSSPRELTENINYLSNKYLRDYKLKDEYGVKEISLDHLLKREYKIIKADLKSQFL